MTMTLQHSSDLLFQQFRLDGQVAIVTGAASGIGRGAALVLATLGCHDDRP